MRRIFSGSIGFVALSVLTAQQIVVANAATPARMMQECRLRAGEVLRTRLPNIETKYEGQRTDGTHAVNGTARFDGRTETFQCSFNRAGRRIVNFVVNQPSGGAQARRNLRSGEPENRTERVRFGRGATGATLDGSLEPGASIRYIMRAKNSQFLSVNLETRNRRTHFNIITPKNTMLYESAKAKDAYRGQLYMDGDHVIEVYNRSQRRARYSLTLGVDRGNRQGGRSGGGRDAFAEVKSDCVQAVAKQVRGNRSPSVINVKRGENFFTVRVRVPGAQAPWICEHNSRRVMRVYYGAEG